MIQILFVHTATTGLNGEKNLFFEMDYRFNEKLIEEVRKYSFLYDLSSPDYRNVQKKDKAWKSIGVALSANDELCKKRWKTLRDSYKRNIRSDNLASGSAAPPEGKKWKYADAMSFLKTVADCRPTIGTRMDETDGDPLVEVSIEECSEIPVSFTSMDHNICNAKPSKKQEDADLKANFTEVMAKCYKKLDEIVSDASTAVKTPTLQLFESLASKITTAALTQEDVDAIERRMVNVVHEEILNRRQRQQ